VPSVDRRNGRSEFGSSRARFVSRQLVHICRALGRRFAATPGYLGGWHGAFRAGGSIV